MKFYRALQHEKHNFSPNEASCHHCTWEGDGENTIVIKKEDYDEIMKYDEGPCFGNCGDHRIPVEIVEKFAMTSEEWEPYLDTGGEIEVLWGVCRILPGVCAVASPEEIREYVSKNWTFSHDFNKGPLDPDIVEFEGEIVSEISDGLLVSPDYNAPYTIQKLSEL